VKRASLILTVLLLSAALFAQVHGVPPSVTSFGPGRSMTPGIPASVTSLGPNGYNFVCSQPACANPFGPSFAPVITRSSTLHGTHHGGHHRPVQGFGYGYGYGGYAYIPYAVPVPVAVAPDEAAGDDVQQPQEPDPPAPTIYERRPVVQAEAHMANAPAEPMAEASSSGKHVNLSPVSEEKIPVVIVFKDGHQQEIANGNYAIVGDMLYDLSGTVAHKIKLADLDLAQTVQQNEQRGVEFSLPASLKPQV